LEKTLVQKIILLCFSVVLCSGALWWGGSRETEHTVQMLTEQPVAAPVREIRITICVSGAVVNPGIYQIAKGSRARQAIELAGGVTEEADMDRVNLAQLCKDGGHVKVPRLPQTRLKQKRAEACGLSGSDASVKSSDGYTDLYRPDSLSGADMDAVRGAVKDISILQNGKGGRKRDLLIHLGSADEAELEKLPGVGESTARRIVMYREQHGFRCIEDIMKVSGIGVAKFAKMKPYLAL